MESEKAIHRLQAFVLHTSTGGQKANRRMYRFGGNILRFQREAVRSFGSQSGRHGTTILCVRKNGKVVCLILNFSLLAP
jgi:hypothetical protein